jgi:adenine nucleotide transporter 17
MANIANKRGSPINSFEFFCMGAAAKAIATVLTYPIQIAQSQLRADRAGADGKRKYSGTMDCLIKVWQVAGLGGLYRGMIAKLWQVMCPSRYSHHIHTCVRSACSQAHARTPP